MYKTTVCELPKYLPSGVGAPMHTLLRNKDEPSCKVRKGANEPEVVNVDHRNKTTLLVNVARNAFKKSWKPNFTELLWQCCSPVPPCIRMAVKIQDEGQNG